MLKRYEWEDLLIQAKVDGVINDGELLVALKLAKVINWKLADGPELRWANEDAAKAVGISRSSFYRRLKRLKASGYLLYNYKGNLFPHIPETTGLASGLRTARHLAMSHGQRWA